jgi:hypothetical protein
MNPFASYEPMSETVGLTSQGMFYPMVDGKRITEVKVMDLVTQDENILLSPTLLESGEMITELLKRKVVSPYPVEKFTTGDRLSLLVYLRATMEQMYKLNLTDPETNLPFEYDVDLMALETKELKHLPSQEGLFEFKLPKANRVVTFRLLTGEDEKLIRQKEKREQQLKNTKDSYYKIFRFEQQIVSIEGIDDVFEKSKFLRNMNIMDSRKLYVFMDECMPSINFEVEVTAPSGARFQTTLAFNIVEFFFPDL